MKHSVYKARYLLLIIILAFGIGGLAAQFAGGSGTLADPYRVQTPEHLNNVRFYRNAHFVQIADIDLLQYLSPGGAGYNSGQAWEPIGTETPDMSLRFIGTYDGDGYLISNLLINRPSQHYIGFFGFLGVGSGVKNVGLVDANISGGMQVGGLVGGTDQAWVANCFVQGSVSSTAITGLLAGSIANGSNVQRCYSSGSVNAAGNTVGGLLGALSNYSNLSASHSHTQVTSAGEAIGGLIGLHWISSSVTDCYSTGVVLSPGDDVGGLIGKQLYDALIQFSYWDTQTSGLVYSAGGEGKSTAQMYQQSTFIGWNFGTVWSINEGSSYPFYQWQALQTPQYSPEPGVYDYPVMVNLTHPNPSAGIYYRISEDQIVWNDWLLYNGNDIEVPIDHTLYIEAYASRPGYYQSDIAEATFTVLATLTSPTADPPSGTYQGLVTVSLSSVDDDVQIHYTTDGSEPTDQSPVYQEPLTFISDTVLQARSFKDGWIPSSVLLEEYMIEPLSVDDQSPVVAASMLFSAYPNPFNPDTNLSFFLSFSSYARLAIYNARGQLIRTLVSSSLSSGMHNYAWDGRDANGNVVTSGIYYYSLHTDRGIYTKKMLMIK